MAMRVGSGRGGACERLLLGCAPAKETGARGWDDGRRRWRRMDGWRDGGGGGGAGGGAVLPVAVGHGILSLLLLEELCDGQQLFQHVLRENKQKPNQIRLKFRRYYYLLDQ